MTFHLQLGVGHRAWIIKNLLRFATGFRYRPVLMCSLAEWAGLEWCPMLQGEIVETITRNGPVVMMLSIANMGWAWPMAHGCECRLLYMFFLFSIVMAKHARNWQPLLLLLLCSWTAVIPTVKLHLDGASVKVWDRWGCLKWALGGYHYSYGHLKPFWWRRWLWCVGIEGSLSTDISRLTHLWLLFYFEVGVATSSPCKVLRSSGGSMQMPLPCQPQRSLCRGFPKAWGVPKSKWLGLGDPPL